MSSVIQKGIDIGTQSVFDALKREIEQNYDLNSTLGKNAKYLVSKILYLFEDELADTPDLIEFFREED